MTKDEIEAAVRAEEKALHLPDILPGMSQRLQIAAARKHAGSREALAILKVLRILAEDYDRQTPSQRAHVAKGVGGGGVYGVAVPGRCWRRGARTGM